MADRQGRSRTTPTRLAAQLAVVLLGAVGELRAESGGADADSLRQELEALVQREEDRRQRIEELEASIAQMEGRLPADSADLWSRQVGDARIRLMDVGLGVLMTAGSSSKNGDVLKDLEGGQHDPRQRGFTINQLELSFLGAVDPYLRGQAYLIFQVNDEGETNTELEEAYLTTQRLPFGLEERGLQLEAGQFFTEFGRNNPTHPHSWAFVDQPFVVTRLLGGDGMRAPGVRVGWLTPLPWFSEINLGIQNAKGETQVSFLANDEVFEERPIGGRPAVYDEVHGLDDFAYLVRWANGFDVGETWSSQVGVSALFGPNATGSDARTQIYGLDWVAKWQPLQNDRGWPHLELSAEGMYRNYKAAAFSGDLEQPDGSSIPAYLPTDHLKDWGLYAQAVWGFRRGWSAGLRYGYGSSSGDDYDETGTRVSANEDPYRSTRHRVSPLLFFDPTDFSRIRLQYNYDHAKYLDGNDAHTVWLGVEFSLGAHPAHEY